MPEIIGLYGIRHYLYRYLTTFGKGVFTLNWKDRLLNPLKICKPIPFWSLNDLLDEEELVWQIKEMSKAGIGGVFLHARAGLKTDYMSERWMELVELCLKEGEKYGIDTWLYDEEGFPSGFAGGAIPKLGIEYQMKWLEYEELEDIPLQSAERVLGTFWVPEELKTFQRVSETYKGKYEKGKSKIIRISWNTNEYYVDNLNEKVVKAFLEYTHEAYKSKFQKHFGSRMPGIFTDEPTFYKLALPWSLVLPDAFWKRHGYDIVEKLPALFYNLEGCGKVRYDYWETVSYLFTTAYSKQISEWCRDNDFILTGHVDDEETLVSQLRSNGGTMAFYQYMQVPGIDWLGRRIENPVTPKQVSSVANQLGKRHVLSEMFACTGWNVSFEELKWIAEWQYVMGINVMCQHLQLYSIRGSRKNDYPPSLYYQQPWWNEYKHFNEYFSRLGTVLSEGKRICNILLIHPIRSAWTLYSPYCENNLGEIDRAFADISRWLMELHEDFDYGDEGIMADCCRVEGKKLIVGEASYDTVILPPLVSLDARTLEVLHTFADAGGLIISLGRFPDMIQGIDAGETLKLLRCKVIEVAPDKKALEEILKKCHLNGLRIRDKAKTEIEDIYCQMRETELDERVLFTVNLNQKLNHDAEISLSGRWKVELLNIEGADLTELKAAFDGGRTTINLVYAPSQSYLTVWTESKDDGIKENQCLTVNTNKVTTLKRKLIDEWEMHLDGDNSLTLDYASLSIDGGVWTPKMPVVEILENLLKAGRPVKASLMYDFEVHCEPHDLGKMIVGIEDPFQYSIRVNDEEIPAEVCGWWRDKSIKLIDILKYLRKGNNTICLDFSFSCSENIYRIVTNDEIPPTEYNRLTFDMEISSIYVLGNFYVYSKAPFYYEERNAVLTEGLFVISNRKSFTIVGDLTSHGLCFYAGNIRFTGKVELDALVDGQRIYLDLVEKPFAVTAKIWINGKPVASLCWAPYMADITDFVHPGANEINVELFGSCRNAFGPHHHVLGESYFIGPSSFSKHRGWAERHLTDESIWRDRYCFVKFGLAEEPQIIIGEERAKSP